MARLLLIDDDSELGAVLTLPLQIAGHELHQATDPKDGRNQALSGQYDLVLIDVGLPGANGFDICRAVRNEDALLPIIMLTGAGAESDKVLGLERGADDYVTKPFSVPELIARIASTLRRAQLSTQSTSRAEEPPIVCGPLTVDPGARRATIGTSELPLTAIEFDILLTLVANPTRAYTREDLAHAVWGYAPAGFDHAITSHVSRLRGKLDRQTKGNSLIETMHGFGYRLRPIAPETL